MQQYFAREPESASRPAECHFSYRGASLTFETDSGVFSRGEMDEGTRLLLEALPPLSGDVLDLGCGWGAVGVSIAKAYPEAKVCMGDVNLRALSLAWENAARNGVSVRCEESDGLAAFAGQRFDTVATNPPIRAGKQVVYRLLAEAVRALKPGGELYVVIRKQQGAESCQKHLRTLCGDVERVARDKGFWVLRAREPLAEAAQELTGRTEEAESLPSTDRHV
ncbi:MAG: methyltransferase [Clostridia bacterium]|nr:methyltransferase [Clostridia bacterium]